MMYERRPGIVLLRICGADLLVATRQIWEKFPAVRPVPRIWAACWGMMEKGYSSEEVIDTFAQLFRKPKEEMRGRLDKVFETLYSEGYLIEAEEEQ